MFGDHSLELNHFYSIALSGSSGHDAKHHSTNATRARRAPPPADEPPPAKLLRLVEAYRKKFEGPQPTGEACRTSSAGASYVYVHWYLDSGLGNRIPSIITGAAIALLTGRRLILPSYSRDLFSPSIPVCYHDPGFGGTHETALVSPNGFPDNGSKIACICM